MLPTARCKIVDTSAPRTPLSLACVRALDAGAILIDIASLPVKHDMSHVPPLCVSPMRPLALDDADPLRVHVMVDGSPLSIHTICDTAEWMGHAGQTHSAGAAPPLRVVCDASLQKQVHPHLLRMYLDQTAPAANPPPHMNGGRAHKTGSSWPGRHANNWTVPSFGCLCSNHCRAARCSHTGDGPWRH